MKDFALDSVTGDVIIKSKYNKEKDIQYTADDKNLTIQKIRMALGTNKGEWKLNEEEGINFHVILTKNPSYDQILDTVQDGLHQIDETLRITSYSFETMKRKLLMKFTASNGKDEDITLYVGDFTNNSTKILVCAEDAETVMRSGTALEALAICSTDNHLFNANKGKGAIW